MDNHLENFKQFMKQRQIAARAYLPGDPEMLNVEPDPSCF